MTIDPTNRANPDVSKISAITINLRGGDEHSFDAVLEQKAEKEDMGAFAPRWSADAPKGGRVVLARALKESSAVPLFLAQTFVQSLRDVGYDSTTSALCEHIDNAIGAEAKEIRVLFRQTGKKGELKTDILVQDNGTGMAPNVLKVATSFGGSMAFNNRKGIGRFGMGMKTAGLSIAPAIEIISWQEAGAYYRMVLDTVAIGRDKANLIQLDDPEYLPTLDTDITSFFTNPMGFPKDSREQSLLAPHGIDVSDALGSSGTIVYMPDCDRLSSATARTLVEDATKTFAHVYRRTITKGLRIYVNNRLVEASDPTLSMATARHVRFPALDDVPVKTSRLVTSRRVSVSPAAGAPVTYDVLIRIYALPIREWSKLTRKALSDIGVFNDQNVSMLRNDREVFAGHVTKLGQRHSSAAWYRIEIDFPGELDEAFGVASNKQGVRMKDFVIDAIKKAIGDDLASIRADVEQVQAQNAMEKKGSGPSPAEMRANEADPFQPEQLDARLGPEDQAQMEENLRGLAIGLRRENETEEEAFQRVKASRYIIRFHHDKFWPFYVVDHKFGRVILTINTAHPFYSKLYEPLINRTSGGDGEELAEAVKAQPDNLATMLDLMLLSMARAQSLLSQDNEDAAETFETFRQSWSNSLRIQMSK
jgi:hypothetical protein